MPPGSLRQSEAWLDPRYPRFTTSLPRCSIARPCSAPRCMASRSAPCPCKSTSRGRPSSYTSRQHQACILRTREPPANSLFRTPAGLSSTPSVEAQYWVADWLSPSGILRNVWDLDEFQTTVFENAIPANPTATLNAIERIVYLPTMLIDRSGRTGIFCEQFAQSRMIRRCLNVAPRFFAS